jgi:hypothetical protein
MTEKERIYLIRLLKAQITKEAETNSNSAISTFGEAPEED